MMMRKSSTVTFVLVVCAILPVILATLVTRGLAGTPRRKFRPPVLSGAYLNPLQLALNYTYEANQIATFSGAPYAFSQPNGAVFDGANIWVADASSNKITKLRAADGSFVGLYGGGALTTPVTPAFDGQYIWVSNHTTNTVTKIRASNGNVVWTKPVGNHPDNMAFDGTYMWVSNGADGTVSKVTKNGTVVCTSPLIGSNTYGMIYDGQNIWVVAAFATSQVNNLAKVNTADCSIVKTVTVGNKPVGIAFDILDGSLWITNSGDNDAVEVDISTGNIVATAPVGSNPQYATYDGANIWVANIGDNTVTKLRASDGSLVGTFSVGIQPDMPIFDGANVWVTNAGSNSVSKM